MSLIPVDNPAQVSVYKGKRYNPDILDSNFSAKKEFPIDPKNDLLPPAYAMSMGMGPPEDSKRYFSLSINDIERYQKKKIKKEIQIFEKILGNCFRKIREFVMRDQKYIIYTIPEYMIGFPSYNISKCAYYVNKKLTEEGYITKLLSKNVIFVCWNIPINKNTQPNRTDRVISVQPENPPVLNKYTTQKEEQFLFS